MCELSVLLTLSMPAVSVVFQVVHMFMQVKDCRKSPISGQFGHRSARPGLPKAVDMEVFFDTAITLS